MNEEVPRDMARQQALHRLVRDLADLARAQARLTADVLELMEVLERPAASSEIRLEPEARTADNPDRGVEPAAAPMPVASEPPAAQPATIGERTEERAEEAEAEPLTVEVAAVASPNGGDAAAPVRPPEEAPAAEVPAPARPGVALEVAPDAGAPEPAGLLEEDEEGSEAGEEEEDEEAVVLTLESGDAKVGVFWDQVAQIGSLPGPDVPEVVHAEAGAEAIDLVSLGRILHGISREERYFVVLSEKGERVAVAAERMLGIGPVGATARDQGTGKIQVLRVPMLKTFARKAVAPAGASQVWAREREVEEERDRNGPLRALVAVRYLPARVAICRYLRGRGWQVGEAAGTEAATVSLDLGRWDMLFLEAPSNGNAEDAEVTLLRRVGERGIPIIRVGSRISGYPAQGGPALMFPFSEVELEAVLAKAGGHTGS
jgi:hypothetical protein